MRITKDKPDVSMNLRERAEKRARRQIVEFGKQRGQDTAELVHELRVHQIELEIQNEELRNTQLELAESRNKYCELYDFAPVGYFTLNKEGLIVGANLTGAAFMGEERNNLLKSKFSRFVAPDSQDEFYLHRKQVFEGGAVQSCEVKLHRKDGSEFPAQLVSVAITDQKGEYDQFRMTMTDITERKKAEERLQEESNLLRTVIDHIPDKVYVKDKNGRFITCNKATLNSEHLKSETEIIGKTDFDLYDRKTAQKLFDDEQELIRTGKPSINLECQHIAKTGDLQSALQTKVPLSDSHGNIVGIVGIDRDITERMRVEHKILEYQKHLKQLASRLTLTEERERRRIAGEIHDEISQTLAIVNIKLDTLRNSPPSKASAAEIEEISSSVEKVIQETRTLTFELSNPILYELGFEVAVAEWLSERVQAKHGIATEFQDDGEAKPLDDDVKVMLFRNIRELLINCIKHASAGKVRVNIRRTNGSIEVVVEDNGVGFDPAEIRSTAGKKTKFGLFSIRESLENLGGRFEIESKTGAGCKAVMTAPLKDQSHKKEV